MSPDGPDAHSGGPGQRRSPVLPAVRRLLGDPRGADPLLVEVPPVDRRDRLPVRHGLRR